MIQFTFLKDHSRSWVGNENSLFISMAGSRRITHVSRQAGKMGEPWVDPLTGFLGCGGLPGLQALVLNFV